MTRAGGFRSGRNAKTEGGGVCSLKSDQFVFGRLSECSDRTAVDTAFDREDWGVNLRTKTWYRWTRLFLLVGMALLVLVSLSACGDDSTSSDDVSTTVSGDDVSTTVPGDGPSEEGSIKIGGLFPMTGRDAIFGMYYTRALQIALDRVDWTIGGRPVELMVEDEGGDPTTALEKARKLVETDGVDVIIGPLSSEGIVAIGPYSDAMKVPLIPGKSTPLPAIDHKYYIGLGNEYQYGTPLAWYAYEELGARTANTLVADFETGNLMMEAFKAEFERLGGQVVQQQAEPFVVDFAPYLTNLEDADVMVAWPIGTGQQFITQYAERNLFEKMPIITPILSGMSDPFIATYQELGDKILGIKGLDTYSAAYDYPTNNEFVAAYQKAYGGYPDGSLIGAGAMGAYIVIQTLEATGGDTDPDLFMETLLKTEFDTPSGKITFDPSTKWATMNFFMMDTVLKDGVPWPEVLKVYNVGYPVVKP